MFAIRIQVHIRVRFCQCKWAIIGDSAYGSIAGVRTCAWDSRKLCRLEPLDLRPNSLCKRPLCFGRIQISRLLVYRFWIRCIKYELFNKCSYDIRFKVCLHVTYFSRPVSVITIIFTPANEVCECYVFTGVCLYTGEGGCVRGGVPGPRGVPAPGGGSGPRGSGPGWGAWWRPPGRLLLRVVRILLECILVKCVLSIVIKIYQTAKITEKNWSVLYSQSPLAQF